MPKPITSEDYSRRLQRVVAHITTHLDEPIDLARLAEIACFSPYHFHRIYRTCMGETVGETVSRQRLTRAATELARTSRPLGEIARRAGYGSDAAFSRAFSAAHGRPPLEFRKAHLRRMESGETLMPVEIQNRAPMRLATIEHQGPYAEIGRTFEMLTAWAGPRGALKPGAVGVALYPGDHTCEAADSRAIVGVTVEPEIAGDETVSIYEVPGGRHAVLLHRGPYAELPRSYDELFAWLPTSGEEPGDAPVFEVNLNNPRDTSPADLLTEICLPIR